MLKVIEQYLNQQGVHPSCVEPFEPDDFVLVINDRVSRFSLDQKKPELCYTFFIDYLVNAISRNNKGSVRGISLRISKFLCTVIKHSKDNPELVLLAKFLTPTFYGTVDCMNFYLKLRKLVLNIFSFDFSPANKLNGLEIDITRSNALCSAMRISFSKTCQI